MFFLTIAKVRLFPETAKIFAGKMKNSMTERPRGTILSKLLDKIYWTDGRNVETKAEVFYWSAEELLFLYVAVNFPPRELLVSSGLTACLHL